MNIIKRCFIFLFIASVFLFNFNSTLAEGSDLYISGSIKDYNSEPLEGVKVSIFVGYRSLITEHSKEIKLFTTTDEQGNYLFKSVPLGPRYIIRVEKEGYCSAERTFYEFVSNNVELNFSLYESDYVKAEKPVVFVNAGLGSGVAEISLLAQRIGLEYDWSTEPQISHLESGVGFPNYDPIKDSFLYFESKTKASRGTKFKTLILVMSSPYKGIHAPSNIDSEIERIKENIKWAKENGVTIIGIHFEGELMRNDSAIGIEEVIGVVALECDMLLVTASGNTDDRFTRIAIENDIPLNVVINFNDLRYSLLEIFSD